MVNFKDQTSEFFKAKSAITIQENSNKFQTITLFFDFVSDETVSCSSNITDNWVENNTAIQDHIALSPITVSLKGFCGELVYEAKQADLDYQSELTQAEMRNALPLEIANFGEYGSIYDIDGKLSTIGAYFPSVSNITQKAQNIWNLHQASSKKASRISNLLNGKRLRTLNSQMNAYSGISSNITQKKLKEIGESLKLAWESRKSFIVETPFGIYENMYIQSITLHQGNDLYVGDIDITLKQIRFAETITTKADKEVLAKYNAMAQASEENYGSAGGEQTQLKQFSDKYLGTTYGSGIKRD